MNNVGRGRNMDKSKTPKSEHLGYYRSLTGPAWRWTLAQEKISAGSFDFLADADEMTMLAARYQSLANESQEGIENANRAYPLVAKARALDGDASRINSLKIMALGRCPVASISQELGIDAAVVEAWESLFFDVGRERRSSSFVARYVVDPEHRCGRGDLAAKFQLAAAGGPAAAWLLLKQESKAPLDSAAELIRKRMDLDLKAHKALSFELKSDRASLRLLKAYADFVLREGRLKQAEERLALRCMRTKQEHELALVRAQAAQQRAQRKAAEEEHKQRQKELAKQAKLDRQVRFQQELGEQIRMERQTREERARNSPLASLCWNEPALQQSVEGRADPPRPDSPTRPAARPPRHAA
jgi:hypothetical protein